MSQMPIEIILTRQLATNLVMPMFIVDNKGGLIFYNESAERILGQRFDESGGMTREELQRLFKPLDEHGQPLKAEELPVIKAIMTAQPAHRKLRITGVDGVERCIEATGFPLIGMSRQVLGGVAIFWEIPAISSEEE